MKQQRKTIIWTFVNGAKEGNPGLLLYSFFPMLLLLIIDSLLRILENNCLGPDIDGQFVGSFAYSDDSIRMIRASRVTLRNRIWWRILIWKMLLFIIRKNVEIVTVFSKKATHALICSIVKTINGLVPSNFDKMA